MIMIIVIHMHMLASVWTVVNIYKSFLRDLRELQANYWLDTYYLWFLFNITNRKLNQNLVTITVIDLPSQHTIPVLRTISACSNNCELVCSNESVSCYWVH